MAKISPLRKQAGGSDESFRQQSNTEAAYGGLVKIAIIDGVLLENLSVSATGTLIEHKLNRNFRGYIICKNDTFCDIKASASPDDSKFISLQASASCVVSLWVF
jgi:hypothetical protein